MTTAEERKAQTARIYERLASLDEETQRRISEKYYHGTRPWLPRRENAPARRRQKKVRTEE